MLYNIIIYIIYYKYLSTFEIINGTVFEWSARFLQDGCTWIYMAI